MTVIQHKIRRFATIQSDFGHIWEQEAASSSLATPIKKRENQRTEQAAVAHCQEMWGVSSHLILSQKEAAVVTQRPLFTIMSK